MYVKWELRGEADWGWAASWLAGWLVGSVRLCFCYTFINVCAHRCATEKCERQSNMIIHAVRMVGYDYSCHCSAGSCLYVLAHKEGFAGNIGAGNSSSGRSTRACVYLSCGLRGTRSFCQAAATATAHTHIADNAPATIAPMVFCKLNHLAVSSSAVSAAHTHRAYSNSVKDILHKPCEQMRQLIRVRRPTG